MYKVIFHIDEKNQWAKAINNVNNIIKEFDINNFKYDIIVLANSNSVLGYLDNKLNEHINSFNSFVTFKACNNSLNSNNIDKSLLNKNIEIVPSGVFELVLKQNDNYLYIKL